MATFDFTPDELKSEEWRDIPDYEGWYQVSNLGRVRRACPGKGTYAGRILQPGDKNGYPVVNLHKNGNGQAVYIHRIVALVFVGPEPKYEVNHINGDRTDNRPNNLEWVTHTGNMQNAVERGANYIIPARKGEASAQAILTANDVKKIRAEYTGKYGELTKYARRYGVTPTAIWNVVNGKTWTHI